MAAKAPRKAVERLSKSRDAPRQELRGTLSQRREAAMLRASMEGRAAGLSEDELRANIIAAAQNIKAWSMLIPTSLDEIVRDSRQRVSKLRQKFPNPGEFDHYVSEIVSETLVGYSPEVVAFVMAAIFGKENRNAEKYNVR
jgi:DNA-binding NarL/FixJ family response regulator